MPDIKPTMPMVLVLPKSWSRSGPSLLVLAFPLTLWKAHIDPCLSPPRSRHLAQDAKGIFCRFFYCLLLFYDIFCKILQFSIPSLCQFLFSLALVFSWNPGLPPTDCGSVPFIFGQYKCHLDKCLPWATDAGTIVRLQYLCQKAIVSCVSK